ncbi:unnamed protein product [Rotaria sordida]|uniref:Uncharacterized protein n=1 Tax=Rotaria sordida TaxID=392033 RepID=A0A813X4R5_9BILA|nr:unnamed protein product [Rotaria sordida]
MVVGNRAKIVRYLLVIPSSLPAPLNENSENDHNHRNKSWYSPTNCTCLCVVFGGLCLTTLLVIGIAISLIMTLSHSVTEMSSRDTTDITIALKRRIGFIIDDLESIFDYMTNLIDLMLNICDTPDPIFCRDPI